MQEDRAGLRRAGARFVATGTVVYIVDAGTLWLLHSKAGLGLALATTLAFCVAFVVNFTMSRLFTFAVSGPIAPQAAKLLVLVGINYVSTMVIVLALSHVWSAFLLSKTIATAVNAVFNFFTYRHWAFAAPADPAAPVQAVQAEHPIPVPSD
jgi:putative flippase GtrA